MLIPVNRRGGAKAWLLIIILIAAAFGYFVVYPKLTSAKRYAAVRAEADDLAAKCRNRGAADERIRFPAKCLIWDVAAGKESAANKHLPESLRAKGEDDLGTLVLVLELRKEETSEYMPLEGTTMGGPPEYRYIYTVGAIAWSTREAAGTFEVIIDPPSLRRGPKDDRPGNWFDLGLADWVRSRVQTR